MEENSNRLILAYAHDFVENDCITIANNFALLLFSSSSSYRVSNNIGLKAYA